MMRRLRRVLDIALIVVTLSFSQFHGIALDGDVEWPTWLIGAPVLV